MNDEFAPRRALASVAVDVGGAVLCLLLLFAAACAFRHGATMPALGTLAAAGCGAIFLVRLSRLIRWDSRRAAVELEREAFIAEFERQFAGLDAASPPSRIYRKPVSMFKKIVVIVSILTALAVGVGLAVLMADNDLVTPQGR